MKKNLLLISLSLVLSACQLEDPKEPQNKEPRMGQLSIKKSDTVTVFSTSNLDSLSGEVAYQQHSYRPSLARDMNFKSAENILANGKTAYHYTPQAAEGGDLYAIEAAAVPVGYGCTDKQITGGGREVFLKPAIMTTSAKRLEARRIQYDPIVQFAAIKHGVDPYFIHGIISQESAYQPRIQGPETAYGKAKGMMQLLDGTGRDMGVPNAMDLLIAEINVNAGTKYLAWLLKKFNGNATLAAASYNAGFGNIINCGYRISPYAKGQTLDYVQKVMGYSNAIYKTQSGQVQQKK